MNGNAYSQFGLSRAVVSPLQIDKPEIYEQMFMKEPRASALSFLRILGRAHQIPPKKMMRNMDYKCYEEVFAFKMAAKISAQVANAADIDVTLDASAHTANGRSMVILRQFVQFPDQTNGYVVAIDRSGGTDVVTVRKSNAAQDIATAAAAAVASQEPLIFYGTGFPERSSGAESRVPDVIEYPGQLQVFRAKFDVTDLERITAKWFEIPGYGDHILYKGIVDSAERFEIDQEIAFLINPKTDGTLVDADGNKIYYTEGAIPSVRAAGGDLFYNPGAAEPEPTITTIENLVKMIRKIRGANRYFGLTGQDLNIGLQTLLRNVTTDINNEMGYNLFPGGKEQALNMNFTAINYTNRYFWWKEVELFNDPDILGADGHAYSQSCLFLPDGKIANPDPDRQTEATYYFQEVYADPGTAGETNKGDFAVVELGMQAQSGPTSDVAVREVHHYGIKGVEFRGRDKAIWMTPTGM